SCELPVARGEGEVDAAFTSGAAAEVGRVTVKVEPRLVPGLWAEIEPPWSSTRRLAIERPRPSPARVWLPGRARCSKGLKMRGRNSGGMPTPESATSTAIASGAASRVE